MDNKEMAKRIANFCFTPKDENSDEFAVQLFIENLILCPNEIEYTQDKIERQTYTFLQYGLYNFYNNKFNIVVTIKENETYNIDVWIKGKKDESLGKTYRNFSTAIAYLNGLVGGLAKLGIVSIEYKNDT